jgi:hypothetical protein
MIMSRELHLDLVRKDLQLLPHLHPDSLCPVPSPVPPILCIPLDRLFPKLHERLSHFLLARPRRRPPTLDALCELAEEECVGFDGLGRSDLDFEEGHQRAGRSKVGLGHHLFESLDDGASVG